LFFALPFGGSSKREMPLFFLPCASSVPAFLCVMVCVICVSRNGGESEKKRENMTRGNQKSLVNQLFTRPFSAREEIQTAYDYQLLILCVRRLCAGVL
jgi:hypothetical protein